MAVADPAPGVSRRGLLGLVGAGAAGLAIGASAGVAGGVAIATSLATARAAASAYDFFGAHQAGITTPVQDHLHFAAFDMMARTDRDDLISLLQDWSYAASRMTQGLEVSATGAVGGSPEAPPDDTGEALGLRRERTHDHLRLRAQAVRAATASIATASRDRRPDGARATSGVPRRRPRSGRVRRRPVHPGVRRRPAGRGARHPQPQPDRVRSGADPLVAAGLRAHLAHDAPHSRRRATCSGSKTARRTSSPTTATRSTSTSGWRHPTTPGVDGRRLLPRRPQDRDADRDLGSGATVGAERDRRARQRRGRTALGWRRVHRARSSATDAGGSALIPDATATCASRTPI